MTLVARQWTPLAGQAVWALAAAQAGGSGFGPWDWAGREWTRYVQPHRQRQWTREGPVGLFLWLKLSPLLRSQVRKNVQELGQAGGSCPLALQLDAPPTPASLLPGGPMPFCRERYSPGE